MQWVAKCHLIENMTKTIHINSLQGMYLLMLDKIWPIVRWQTQYTILDVQKLHVTIFQHDITSMEVTCKMQNSFIIISGHVLTAVTLNHKEHILPTYQ
jgi:hypothetical protein